MSVQFLITDKDDKVFTDNDGKLENAGCWGFLVGFKGGCDSQVQSYKSFLATEHKGGWGSEYHNKTLHRRGVPVGRYDDIGYLRVYNDTLPTAFRRELVNMWQVIDQLPQWFGDWEKIIPKSNIFDQSKVYYRIPWGASGLRNYNALRMYRNFQTAQGYVSITETPMTQLVLTQMIGYGQTRYESRSDSMCVPIFDLGSMDKIVQVLANGPITEDNNDEPLGNLTESYISHDDLSCLQFNRAFIKDYQAETEEDEWGDYEIVTPCLDRAIPTCFYELVPYIRTFTQGNLINEAIN